MKDPGDSNFSSLFEGQTFENDFKEHDLER